MTDETEISEPGEAWRDANADALAASTKTAAEAEEAAERDEETIEIFYAEPDPEAEAQAAEEAAEEQREQAEAEITGAEQWDEADAEVLRTLTGRVQQFNADAAVFTEAYQRAQQLKAAGEAVPFEVQSKLSDEATRLAAEKVELQQAGPQIARAAKQKERAAEQLRFQRAHPALKDKATREAFVEHLVEQGYSRESVETESNPNIIGPAFVKFKAARAETKRKAAEDERHESVSPAVRIAELRAEPNTAIVFYGKPEERKAHLNAVRARRRELGL